MAHEDLLWNWMHDRARRFHNTLHLQRIENLLARGTPDVEGCYLGHSFWIELKAEDRPKRPDTPVHLPMRLEQVLWLEKRWQIGGSCWVYVRIGTGVKASRYIIPGQISRELLVPCQEQFLAEQSMLPGDHGLVHLLDLVTASQRIAPG